MSQTAPLQAAERRGEFDLGTILQAYDWGPACPDDVLAAGVGEPGEQALARLWEAWECQWD